MTRRRWTTSSLSPAPRDIDVVLGGHTHTFMEKPLLYRNAAGKEVPLMHSGRNGAYVGMLEFDIVNK